MMYKYKLIILTGGGYTQSKEFVADSCSTTTNNSSSSGYYAFFRDKKLISFYPIERTIVESIEEIEENK
jgi:hypothetical protein